MEEQKALIECKQQRNDSRLYYQSCISKQFQKNFKNWTSGNHDIDQFIQKSQLEATYPNGFLEWIEFDQFEDVKYLAEGGFGVIHKATWRNGYANYWENNQWKREENSPVALKSLHDSQDITVEFLREMESHMKMNTSVDIVRCYGISKNPETNNYIMVMKYINNGSLRNHLNNNFNSLNWENKLYSLMSIAIGLKNLHENKLIHRDFHNGNILCDDKYSHIADLGLCRPANAKPGNKKIYGVLPYVAPEVLRMRGYTQSSDIYGFGIIMHEVCTGFPPYHDIAHDEFLAIEICQGLRPTSDYKIPELILTIIKQCWDADPLKRPNAEKLKNLLWVLYDSVKYKENKLINLQIEKADEVNKKLPLYASTTSILSYTTHPQACHTSRLLDFKNLPEPKNVHSDNSFETEYSESLESARIDFGNRTVTDKSN